MCVVLECKNVGLFVKAKTQTHTHHLPLLSLSDSINEQDDNTGTTSLNDTYHQARYKRQTEELIQFKDKAEANTQLLNQLRTDLENEKEHNLEHQIKHAEADTEIKELQSVQVQVHELTALNNSLQNESDTFRTQVLALQQQGQLEATTAATALARQTNNLAQEQTRSHAMETTIQSLTKQMQQLETQLTAGRKAMQTMQEKILGKSGQRLAIMAVDLEKTVADFENKQDRLVEQEMVVGRREREMAEKEVQANATAQQHAEKEIEITRKTEDVASREKKVANWKEYAAMQENAFERRDR